MGAKIIQAKGKTHYGIVTCVCYLADAIINQRPIIAPVFSTLLGEHGVRGIELFVPSVVGPSGVQKGLGNGGNQKSIVAFSMQSREVQEVLNQIT